MVRGWPSWRDGVFEWEGRTKSLPGRVYVDRLNRLAVQLALFFIQIDLIRQSGL